MKKTIIIMALLSTCSLLAMPENNNMMSQKLLISANGKKLVATFSDNSSAVAFRNLIADAPLTVSMSDYGDFEKVGSLGHNLPTNDTRITTEPGDIILYLGNNITIYYGVNTWTFTLLGKIDGNPTRESILSVLGNGTANVTFSLKDSSSSLKSISKDSDNLEVYISGRMLTLKNTAPDSVATVFGSNGVCVYWGTDKSIEIRKGGIYIVECGNAKAKVLIK